MRILFLVHKTGRIRHFDEVILRLAERGHDVALAALPKKGALDVPAGLEHPRVTIVSCPRVRADRWRDLVEPHRLARDYVHFFHPRFAHARFLLQHADVVLQLRAPGLERFFGAHPGLRRRWRLAERALELAEELTPSDPIFERFIRAHRPDIVLVTPLILFGSYQADYVKAAHRLGLPVAHLPFSWDNLTVRGRISVLPDRILVWNEPQAREAVELHGMPPERVIVTGAPRFDDFFAMRAATTRERFCADSGLDPARPFLLYLGSAKFVTGRREIEFARRWVGEIRQASDPRLRTCGVLIRPHPALQAEWHDADFADFPGVALSGSGKMNADPLLYDSLHHAAAAVGLNTSAMIEAGIVGKPVYTILVPEFEGQEGTLHFDYLLRANGGLVSPARGFDEHRRQLAAALASGDDGREQTRRFLEGFVRPYGLDVPATPIMVRKIEELAELRKRPRRTPLWHYPARAILRAWLIGRGVHTWAPPRLEATESQRLSPAVSMGPIDALNGAPRKRQPTAAGRR